MRPGLRAASGDAGGFHQPGALGLFPEFLCAQQRGQMFGNAVESGRALGAGALLLRGLETVPLCPNRRRGPRLRHAEDMGMAVNQLADQAARDAIKVERPALTRELAARIKVEK